MERVGDCLDEEIDGETEDLFDAGEDNPMKEDGRAEVDIMLSQRKCGFLFSGLLNSMQTRMKFVLSVRVSVSGVLCHMDSSTDTSGHDDG